ncbi:MAG: Uma2 family endonuclease [bacterium]
MRSAAERRCSVEEYLAFERASEERHEFLAGEVFAMGGASMRHNTITLAAASELLGQLKGGTCRVFASEMRVKVADSGLYTYPDIVVACGAVELEDDFFDTLLNPTLIIEVLSPSTEAYDRGEKFEHYRKLATLREYVLIAQDRAHVEQFSRQADGHWLLAEWDGLAATVTLPSIGAALALGEIYADI